MTTVIHIRENDWASNVRLVAEQLRALGNRPLTRDIELSHAAAKVASAHHQRGLPRPQVLRVEAEFRACVLERLDALAALALDRGYQAPVVHLEYGEAR